MHAVVVSLLLLVPSAEPAAPAAMVLSSKGEVNIQRGKKTPRKVRAMAILAPGDRLSTADGAEAVLVLLGDGHRERLRPGASAAVQPGGLVPPDAGEKLPHPKLPPANLASLRDLARSARGGIGVLRGDLEAEPRVMSPMYGTAILTLQPEFSWPAAATADGYVLELLSGPEGRAQVQLWKATTRETRLPYPDQQKPLKYGLLYRWRVRPLVGEDRGDPIVVSKFFVLTKSETAALAGVKELTASETPEDWVTAAALYEAYGAYSEALPLYERLAQRFPDEPAFQLALASYYHRAGRPDRARQAQARARELGVASAEP